MTLYAEVIGDPVAHSLSPAIHRHWLAALGIEGEFRATHVSVDGLAAFLEQRRSDPSWRGCSVTLPHKERIAPLLDGVDKGAADVGAINCVHRRGSSLLGANTDVDGIGCALDGVAIQGGKAVVIGAGGAARAALSWLGAQQTAEIILLVRDPARAEPLLGPSRRAVPIASAHDAIRDARIIINASPLGMVGNLDMPPHVLDALRDAPGATVMDMVYKPLETRLLAAARAAGLRTADGLEMLIGQARRAFTLFFGHEPPATDAAIRALIEKPARGL